MNSTLPLWNMNICLPFPGTFPSSSASSFKGSPFPQERGAPSVHKQQRGWKVGLACEGAAPPPRPPARGPFPTHLCQHHGTTFLNTRPTGGSWTNTTTKSNSYKGFRGSCWDPSLQKLYLLWSKWYVERHSNNAKGTESKMAGGNVNQAGKSFLCIPNPPFLPKQPKLTSERKEKETGLRNSLVGRSQ